MGLFTLLAVKYTLYFLGKGSAFRSLFFISWHNYAQKVVLMWHLYLLNGSYGALMAPVWRLTVS